MVMLRFAVAVWGVGVVESTTLTVKLEVPVARGVPEITPSLASGLNPTGRLPAVRLQVYGGTPLLACKVWLYPMFTVPAGSDPVATDSGGGLLTVILSAWVTTVPAASVTCTVKLEVPKSVGVPVISAEELVLVVKKLKPAGRLPEINAQVKFAGAPAALTNAS
jgi:hypothetical protein